MIGHAEEYVLSIASFSIEENSLTAKIEPVRDTNNQKCALVIINGFDNETLRFNVGNTFSKVEQKTEHDRKVYWLWIPEGTIKVTISSDSQNFSPLEYFFNPRVKKGETYLLNLNLSAAKTIYSKQYLEFNIEPTNASLEVNNELWPVSNGISYRQVPKGKYQYQIKAKDYYTEAGIIDFNDLSRKETVKVQLKPKFGWLTISSSIPNTIVFIDDEQYNGSLNKIKLASGEHTVKVARELYQTYTNDVLITDNQETKLSIELKPNFSKVNISVKDGADIYIDDERVGKDMWSGDLLIGNYNVDLKKINHKPLSKTISINVSGEDLNFEFGELEPILGSISIESEPSNAIVQVDGKNYGTTPLLIPEIIVGKHNISLSLSGYQELLKEIDIREGVENNLSFVLNKKTQPIEPSKDVVDHKEDKSLDSSEPDECTYDITNGTISASEGRLTISSSPANANVYIDGNFVGKTPCTYKNDGNNHNLEISHDGYYNVKEYVNFSKNLTYNLYKEDEIVIYSFPPRANVYIDGKLIGTSPCAIKKDYKEHKLEIDKKGYFKVSEHINLGNPKYLIHNLTKIDERTRNIYDPRTDD